MARLSSNSNLSMLRQPAALPTEAAEQNIKDIFKCGYCSVKLIKDSELASTAYQKFWAIFYVLNERAPILELFKKEQPLQNFNSQDSVAKFNLKSCNYVSIPILSANDKENSSEFVISLDAQLLQICVESADSNDGGTTKELLQEWVNCLREKLASLNVFSSKDNPYSKEPVHVARHGTDMRRMATASRPPMPLPARRPLPPIPSQTDQTNETMPPVVRTMERILEQLNERRANSAAGPSNHLASNHPATHQTHFPPTTSHQTNFPTSSNESNYEPLAAAASNDQEPATRRSSSSICSTSSNGSQVLSLRESQIVTLRKEISNPGGVKLRIRKVDCVDSLALVEWIGRIFIAGWKQKVSHALLI